LIDSKTYSIKPYSKAGLLKVFNLEFGQKKSRPIGRDVFLT